MRTFPGKGFHSNGNRVGDKPLGLDMYGFKIRVDLPEKEVVYGYMQKDKKKIAGKLKFVLPTKVGEVMQTTDVSKDEIFAAFDYITK